LEQGCGESSSASAQNIVASVWKGAKSEKRERKRVSDSRTKPDGGSKGLLTQKGKGRAKGEWARGE